MQELQHANLDPTESPASTATHARAIQEEDLRRRRNHSSGGGNGVRFSTVFSIVDNSLDDGAETLKKLPKRSSSKDADPEKSALVPVAAQAETKPAQAEAPKEAPKARTESESKARPVKEETARKAETPDFVQAHAAAVQTRIEMQIQSASRSAERIVIRAEKRETVVVEKVKAADKFERRVDIRERIQEVRATSKQVSADDEGALKESAKSAVRRDKPKPRDSDVQVRDARDERRSTDELKAVRADEDKSKSAARRTQADDRPAVQLRNDLQESKVMDRRSDETDPFNAKSQDPAAQAGRAAKRKSITDFESLTGLHARTVVEMAPVIVAPVPVQDISFKASLDVLSRGNGIDAVKSTARVAPANAGSAAHQSGGEPAQSRMSQSKDKLAESARRMAGYLSGRMEKAVNPESTFSDMVTKAKLFMQNGRSEMSIQLKPEHLGNLHIKISMEDNRMEAKFATDRPDVRDLLQQNVDLLKDKLNDAGINVTAVSVEVRSDAGRSSFDGGEQGDRLRKVTVFGGGEDGEPSTGVNRAEIAYALAGMGTHLSLVA